MNTSKHIPPSIKEIVKKIKEKKELNGLADSVVESTLNEILKKYSIPLEKLKPSETKILVKEVRAKLRYYTGQFQKSTKSRPSLLKEDISKLLQTHSSTAERISVYPLLKQKISELNPKSILDLGCGLNPIALASLDITYYASDIKEDELKLIDQFFTTNNIKGETFIHDLKNISEHLPKADICLMFKVIDLVTKHNHRFAEPLLTSIPCKTIIASFSTRKLSGKPMNHPRRIWFEKTLEKMNYSYETLETSNEVFYFIKKS